MKEETHARTYQEPFPFDELEEAGFKRRFCRLDEQNLAGLPGVGWQLGPNVIDSGSDQLSLSVMHAPYVLDDAMFTANFPIHGDGWSVVLGVPPREWDCYFTATVDGKAYAVEGREWYWTIQEQCGVARLVFAVPPAKFANLDKETLEEFAEVMASGELGELNVMRLLASIDVVLLEVRGENWLQMDTLRSRFVQRYPACEYAEWLSSE